MNPIPKYCDTPEKVEEWKEKRRSYNKAYDKARRQTPERKAAAKAYHKGYHQTPEYKAYRKARHQTPEYKAYQKARHQTPEYKAYAKEYMKAHYQTLRKEQFTADAFRMMQAASELSKALTNLPNTKTQ